MNRLLFFAGTSFVTLLLFASLGSRAARGGSATPAPASTAVDIEEKLGGRLPPDLSFTAPDGQRVRLHDLLDGQRPVVLILAYYRCPMLCDLVLAGISRSMQQLGWTPGREYVGLTVSIDPTDTAVMARVKRAAVLQAIGQTGPEAEAGWPFLVGDATSIHTLADAVGFRYAYDPLSHQFAHPAVAVVLTPAGRISRYLYGVDFGLLDVRLAMTEAAQGHVGNIVGRLLLTCFRYDPSTRRYGFYVSAVLKGGATAAFLAVCVMLAVFWRRDAGRERRGTRTRSSDS